jgi:hypothetical protein
MAKNRIAVSLLVALLAGSGCHAANGSQTTIGQQNTTNSQQHKTFGSSPMWVRFAIPTTRKVRSRWRFPWAGRSKVECIALDSLTCAG